MPKCYMCNNESTSVDHAPPKGFFPIDMRNNLITVPACQLHNEDMSKDDEYARNIITMSIENNQTAIDLFFDKVYRSYQRHPGLVNPIKESLKDVSFYRTNAKSFVINRPRFDRVIRKIAYGLFYHEFKHTWDRLLAVTTNQIKMADMNNDHLGEIFDSLTDDLNELVLKGNNPLVFQYAFIDSGPGLFEKGLFLVFFEGFPFWIIPEASSDHPDFD